MCAAGRPRLTVPPRGSESHSEGRSEKSSLRARAHTHASCEAMDELTTCTGVVVPQGKHTCQAISLHVLNSRNAVSQSHLTKAGIKQQQTLHGFRGHVHGFTKGRRGGVIQGRPPNARRRAFTPNQQLVGNATHVSLSVTIFSHDSLSEPRN